MSEEIRGLRASDADREALASDLRTHAIAGRLSTDELEQRLAEAYAARTIGELDGLRADLPATPESVALAARERRAHLVRRSMQETGGSLGAFVVCGAIWAANGATGFFWPLFILIPFLAAAVRGGWELFGPAADLDAVEAKLNARAERHRHGRSGRHGYGASGRPAGRRARHRR